MCEWDLALFCCLRNWRGLKRDYSTWKTSTHTCSRRSLGSRTWRDRWEWALRGWDEGYHVKECSSRMEGSGEIGFNDCVVSFGQGPSSGGHTYT